MFHNIKTLFFLSVILLATNARAQDNMFLLQDSCVRCHLICDHASGQNPVLAWKKSVHFGPGSGCADCHGGNKFLNENFKKNHIGLPDTEAVIKMCGQCHQPELQAFQERRFKGGKKQIKCTVSCVTCHGSHEVRKSDLSLINRQACVSCHDVEHAENFVNTVKNMAKVFASTEELIAQRRSKAFPTQAAEKKLHQVRKDMSLALHGLPAEHFIEHANEYVLTSIGNVEASMGVNSPVKWKLVGLLVVIFLSACLWLVNRYLKTLKPEDTSR